MMHNGFVLEADGMESGGRRMLNWLFFPCAGHLKPAMPASPRGLLNSPSGCAFPAGRRTVPRPPARRLSSPGPQARAGRASSCRHPRSRRLPARSAARAGSSPGGRRGTTRQPPRRAEVMPACPRAPGGPLPVPAGRPSAGPGRGPPRRSWHGDSPGRRPPCPAPASGRTRTPGRS